MPSIWCGVSRFEHGEVTRHDPVLRRTIGFPPMAKFKTVMDSLYQWMFNHININGITLDLDSTFVTRYGAQEGGTRGDYLAKRRLASHHPLMALVADTRIITDCWLGPDNRNSANNVQGFLANTLHRLDNQMVALLRADSGFSDNAFPDEIEKQNPNILTYCFAKSSDRFIRIREAGAKKFILLNR